MYTTNPLLPQSCQVIEEARDEASDYRYLYSQPIPLKVCHTCILPHSREDIPIPPFQLLVDRVSAFMHMYTLYSAIRPFGCTLIYGTYTADGPELYMTEPSGVSWVREVEECLYLTLIWCHVLRDIVHVLWGRPNRRPRQSWRS